MCIRDSPCSSTADPVAVRVPFGAKENTDRIGLADPDAIPYDVEWEYREDPTDSFQLDEIESKLWGTCFFDDIVPDGHRLLLTLSEAPADFNFGGDEFMLSISDSGDIDWVSG